MANRTTILILGDENAAGTRPRSELTSINATYDDPQADATIWNQTTLAWEPLEPGVNTNTSPTTTDKWSLETRAREGLRSKIPTGQVYFIKHTLAGSALSRGTGWAVDATDYANAVATVNAAGAAAGGDELIIGGIEICLFIQDILGVDGWRSFGERMRELIDSLRVDIGALANSTMGSVRNDGGPTPVVIVMPHGEFTGLTEEQKAVALSIRSQLWSLANDDDRIAVHCTLDLTCTDGKKFDAASLVQLSYDAQAGLFPYVQIDDSAFPEAAMIGMAGDSIVAGLGGVGPNPAHLTAAITGANIFFPHRGTIETLQFGVNNNSEAYPLAGPELSLGEQFRAEYGEVWILKGAMPSAYCVTNREPLAAAIQPLLDRWRKDWDPGTRRGLFDMVIRGWMREMVLLLRKQGKRPRMKAFILFLGTNDVLLPVNQIYPFEPGQVVPTLKRIVAFIRREMAVLNIVDDAPVEFIIGMPSEALGAVNDYTKASVAVVRSAMRNWALEDGTIKLQDTTEYATSDGLHWSTQGSIDFANDAFQTWRAPSTATAQPLFTPSKLQFRRALRLSQVALSNDATVMIDQAMTASRARLYQTLGDTMIDVIMDMAYTPSPTSSAEHTRALAASTEIKMVRLELLRVMPTSFMDGSSPVQSWNEEAAFREGGYLQTRDEMRRLEEEIQNNLTFLITGSAASQSGVVSPDSIIAPGETIYGGTI